jgi:cation diffusion facilitator family transporter
VWASAAFAGVSLAWGLLAGSSTIVFDGLYSFASVALSLFAVWALRTSRRGADARYPWGRESWEPVTIVVKAVALAGLCCYALIGAVAELWRGGREIETGWAVLYALLATAASAAVSLHLRRQVRGGGSDLVRAEAAEWWSDTLLSVGVLGGFVLAFGLHAAGRADLARYVDPAMVAVISAVFLRVPAGLIASGLREVLTMAPDPELTAQLWSCARDVQAHYGFAESFLRASKVGGRLDVEIDFVVDDASTAQSVREFDVVRQELHDRLAPLGHPLSMVVSFTADRRWAI